MSAHHIWLSTGAVAMGLGTSLMTGTGVAQAETGSAEPAGRNASSAPAGKSIGSPHRPYVKAGEVSEAVAALLGAYGQNYQALRAQTDAFRDQFLKALPR